MPILPKQAGSYQFIDADGVIIYVGKAVNIKSRVNSYFGKAVDDKARLIVARADRLEYIVTKNEVEALILESNLIKRYKPHYNVLLKDDKHYPFLKLTKEEYPILLFTRRVLKDGGRYFGPYPNASALRKVQELIDSVFPLRRNSGVPLQKRSKACLRFHMGRCLAPCIDNTNPQDYAKVVEQVKAFLDGRIEDTLQSLEKEMKLAASRQNFELAKVFRDRAEALKRLTGYDSNMAMTSGENLDFLGISQAGNYAMVQLFQMRRGRVVGRDKRFLTNAKNASPAEILEPYLIEYYKQASYVPPLILFPESNLDLDFWQSFFDLRSKNKVELRVPKRGDKLDLLAMANRNAQTALNSELAMLERRGEAPGVKELQELVGLTNLPWRIEGYDISNLMGTNTVASIVVFEGGRAKKSQYRKMRITGLDKPDDFYSMHQVIYRRFSGSLHDKMPVPDLLLIDGGKGQLSSAKRALNELNIEIPMLGLAKKQETIITEGKEEIIVPVTHPALRLLINIRDEAHRTAVGYNRKRRGAAMTRSILEDIPGVGKKRSDALLANFSSIDQIKAASVDEIAGIAGVGKVAAQAVKDFFAD